MSSHENSKESSDRKQQHTSSLQKSRMQKHKLTREEEEQNRHQESPATATADNGHNNNNYNPQLTKEHHSNSPVTKGQHNSPIAKEQHSNSQQSKEQNNNSQLTKEQHSNSQLTKEQPSNSQLAKEHHNNSQLAKNVQNRTPSKLQVEDSSLPPSPTQPPKSFISQLKQKIFPSTTSSSSKQIQQQQQQHDDLKHTMEDVEPHTHDENYSFDYEQLLTWEYDPEEFDPFKFIAHLPTRNGICDRPISIPKKRADRDMTLVLDLDETLVHCSSEVMKSADFVFPVRFKGVLYQVYVRKRPHFEEFLKQCSQWFEVIVFTASEKAYADKLLNIIDPSSQLIHGRAFRDSCVFVEGNYLKDLTVLGRDLNKLIIVDNSPQAYGYHIDNGIPIVSWFDDEGDDELLKLLPLLRNLSKQKDVRPSIREKFKLYKVLEKYNKKV